MSWLRTFAGVGLSIALLAMQATAAAAADMPSRFPPPAPAWQPPPLLNLNYGWYLRGEVGYAWGRLDRADAASGYTDPSDNKLDGGFFGGLGVGIKSHWLRTDVTVDALAPLDYSGSIVSADDVTAKISAISTLFNGYLDLGTWYGVTPYIGAGAGAAYLRVTDYASAVAPPFSGSSHDQWNFAWAAMAGFGYPVAHALMLDVGYRYINFGDVTTNADAFGAMSFRNVAAHEVQVGLRWSFDELYEQQ